MTRVQQAILDFERRPWTYLQSKDQAIRQHFGLEPARYYQLLDDPAALLHAPSVVLRHLRLRGIRRSRLTR